MVTFRSKYDVRLLVVLGGITYFFGKWALEDWHDGVSTTRAVSALCFALLVLTGAWTLAIMRYVLSDRVLDIHCGPLRWRVPLASIRAVAPAFDVSSAPAWSFDRLRVTTEQKEWFISPRDRAGFLAELLARDPGLHRDGEGLVRSAS